MGTLIIKNEQRLNLSFRTVPDGGNNKDLPIEAQKTRNVNIAWTRMNSKKPCFTIDAGHNLHFHYKAIEFQQLENVLGYNLFQMFAQHDGTRTSRV